MRNALLPMIASLAVCGAVTAVFIVSNAHAQSEGPKPMMVAQAAPAGEPGAGPRGMERRMHMPTPTEMAAHMKQMCQDRYAREVGALAYTETSLSLTGTEQSLFQRWKQVKLDIAKRQSDACATHVGQPREAKMPSLTDHLARREEMMKRRLADLQAERPPLEALFNSLSDEQKRQFGHSLMREGMHGHRMFAGGDHRMMGRGPGMMMHRGPGPEGLPPGAPGDAPPAPPPQ